MLEKRLNRQRRHKRVRAKVRGTANVPRLCVTRTNSHIYAQLIDDQRSRTLLSASDLAVKTKKGTKTVKASEVGKLIAKEAKEKNIERIVFDRGGYKYHGRVKALAEAARAGGLKF